MKKKEKKSELAAMVHYNVHTSVKLSVLTVPQVGGRPGLHREASEAGLYQQQHREWISC